MSVEHHVHIKMCLNRDFVLLLCVVLWECCHFWFQLKLQWLGPSNLGQIWAILVKFRQLYFHNMSPLTMHLITANKITWTHLQSTCALLCTWHNTYCVCTAVRYLCVLSFCCYLCKYLACITKNVICETSFFLMCVNVCASPTAHLQQRWLQLQRADLTRWLQHLHLTQTRSPAQSGKPAAEVAGSRPRRPCFGPVPPQDQQCGLDLIPWPGQAEEEHGTKRRTSGHNGVVWKAVSDHPQSQLPQEMRQQLRDTCEQMCPGVVYLISGAAHHPVRCSINDRLHVQSAAGEAAVNSAQSRLIQLNTTQVQSCIERRMTHALSDKL